MHRRACMQLVRHQHIEVSLSPPPAVSSPPAEVILSRAQRAHTRLSWETRLARNVRSMGTGQVAMKLFGIPDAFATTIGGSALSSVSGIRERLAIRTRACTLGSTKNRGLRG
jgi:hypothetical protein